MWCIGLWNSQFQESAGVLDMSPADEGGSCSDTHGEDRKPFLGISGPPGHTPFPPGAGGATCPPPTPR